MCVVRSPHQTAAILTCSRLWFGGKVFSLDVPWPISRPGVAPGGSGPGSIDAHRHPRPFKSTSGGRSGSEISGKSRSKLCTEFSSRPTTGPTPLPVPWERSPMSDRHRATTDERKIRRKQQQQHRNRKAVERVAHFEGNNFCGVKNFRPWTKMVCIFGKISGSEKF